MFVRLFFSIIGTDFQQHSESRHIYYMHKPYCKNRLAFQKNDVYTDENLINYESHMQNGKDADFLYLLEVVLVAFRAEKNAGFTQLNVLSIIHSFRTGVPVVCLPAGRNCTVLPPGGTVRFYSLHFLHLFQNSLSEEPD